jgi:hypothetical protein
VNRNDNLVLVQAKNRGNILIEDLGNLLDFEVMVPRAQCPHLVALAALGFARDVFGSSLLNASALLDSIQVL